MQVLVVNAGSSSLKLRFLDDRDQVFKSAGLPVRAPDINDRDLIRTLRDWPPPDVVGHRVVHGGTRFTGPVLVDRAAESALRELTGLAPLHQPKSLAAFDAVRAMLPEVAAVACFDTAFHASLPAEAATYAVPREWQQCYGVRRYSFHGLSHAYCSRRGAELIGRLSAGLRVVTCHLGVRASLAAVVDGQRRHHHGLHPAGRSRHGDQVGTVDPGLVLWLEDHEDLSSAAVANALEHQSGAARAGGHRRHAEGAGTCRRWR